MSQEENIRHTKRLNHVMLGNSVLKEASTSGQLVDQVVADALCAHVSTDAERSECSCDDVTIGVNMANIELDGSVVVAGDQLVSGRALPWDVQVNLHALVVLHSSSRGCVRTLRSDRV